LQLKSRNKNLLIRIVLCDQKDSQKRKPMTRRVRPPCSNKAANQPTGANPSTDTPMVTPGAFNSQTAKDMAMPFEKNCPIGRQRSFVNRTGVHPNLDPLMQRALGIIDLPTVYTQDELKRSILDKTDQVLNSFERAGICNSGAAARFWPSINLKKISRGEARLLVAERLYKNHSRWDIYSAGGADYDLYS